MLNLKKTAAAVLAFGSSAVFSGTMGAVCTPGNVTVPCATSAWGIGGQALYLQSVFTGNQSFDPVFGDLIYGNPNGSWNWGFEIEASYFFNTGNDFTVNWYHLNGNSSRHPFTLEDDGSTLGVAGRYKNQWDAINAELGQFFNISANNKIRLYGGAQFAQLQTNAAIGTDATSFFDDLGINASIVSALGLKSKYDGFGPRTGIDMYYFVANGLGIYAKAATAILVGTNKYNYRNNASFLVNGVTTETGAVRLHASRTSLVPELEAKLGATYTYFMPQEGSLTLDVGYMWFNYFHALSTFDIVTCNTKTSDFGASGPYISLKYVS